MREPVRRPARDGLKTVGHRLLWTVCAAAAVICARGGELRAQASTAPVRRAATRTSDIRSDPIPVVAGGPAAGVRDERLEVVARFPDTMPAAVVVSRSGRTFVSFPRWADPVAFSVGELSADGLVPYPNADAHRAGAPDRLVSVQGMDVDADDRLWLLDTAGKLVAYDLATDREVKRVAIPAAALAAGTYLNDVRVDARRGTGGFAFIADSGAGGIVVVDLDTGDAWRRLTDHPSAHASPDFVARAEGALLMYRPPDGGESPVRGHVDGIALGPDGRTLYYSAFSRREVYGVSTDALADRARGEADVATTVRLVATKPSANDGMTSDGRGRVYSTDYEDNAIRRCDPALGAGQQVETIVQDERILWPDAVWVHGRWLYITANQLNRLPQSHRGKDLRTRPYALFRYPLDSVGP